MNFSDQEGMRPHNKERRDLLLSVYRSAIEEYRFNVNLNWDRTKFFLALIAGLIGAGVGLLRFASDSIPAATFLIFFFVLIFGITRLADQAIRRGKEYTAEAIYKKTVVERELGLLNQIPGYPFDDKPNLSIAVTRGMANTTAILLKKKQKKAPGHPLISSGSIVDRIRTLLKIMYVIEVIGTVAATVNVIILLKPHWPVVSPAGLSQPEASPPTSFPPKRYSTPSPGDSLGTHGDPPP